MKKVKTLLATLAITAAALSSLTISAKAAPFANEKFSFAQPDESKVSVIGTGDEFYQHIESLDGYTLMRDEKGWICYAELNEDGTEFKSTGVVYTGKDDNVPEGLEKHLDLTQESINKKTAEEKKRLKTDDNENKSSNLFKVKASGSSQDNFVTFNGTKQEVKGLTVLVDFSDSVGEMSYNDVDNFFNGVEYTGYGNNGSVRDYFKDVFGGELDYTNKIVKANGDGNIYFRAAHEKSYYDNKDRGIGDAGGELVKEVLQFIENNKNSLDLSGVSRNSDGSFKILNVFYAGSASSGWSKGLWPHKSYIYENGKKQVYEMTDMGDELKIGTVIHETAHALLGYPDIYEYQKENPLGKAASLNAGNYCLMGSGSHNGGGKNPVMPNPYFRYVLSNYKGNASIFDLNKEPAGKLLTIESNVDGNGSIYKWTNSSDNKECMMLELMNKKGRYKDINESGLALWKISRGEDYGFPMCYNAEVSLVYAGNPDNYGKGLLFDIKDNKVINRIETPNAKWSNGEYSGLNLSLKMGDDSTLVFEKESTVKPGLYNKNNVIFNIISENGDTSKGFTTIGNDVYYFDTTSGDALLGFQTINSKTYYFKNKFEPDEPKDDLGKMQKGKVEIDGDKYYFDENTGELKKNTFILIDNERIYYTDSEGKLVTNDIREINGKVYAFDRDGVAYKNKKGLACVGDFKYTTESNYCNQGMVGDFINLKTCVLGESSKCTYSYKFFYDDAGETSVRNVKDMDGIINTCKITPKKAGVCRVQITAATEDGRTFTDNIYININPEIKINYVKINGKEYDAKKPIPVKLNEKVKIEPIISGGFAFDDSVDESLEIEYYDFDLNLKDTIVYNFGCVTKPMNKTFHETGRYVFNYHIVDTLGFYNDEVIEIRVE